MCLLVAFAAALRLVFWMPYYIPVDVLDYLNAPLLLSRSPAWSVERPDLAEWVHIVRLGLVVPLAVSGWFLDDLKTLVAIYPFFCSLGTVAMSYLLGSRLGGRQAERIAGGLVAIAPIEVVYAAAPLPDVPLTFFSLVAFWMLLRAQNAAHSGAWALAAGCFLGLAYTCKEPALFFAVVAFLQACAVHRRLREGLFMAAGLAAVVAIEVAVLWVLLDRPYLRIVETFGFIPGTKGNFAHVDRTWGWWLEQIWFKTGALWGLKHLPTAALFPLLPHLWLLALWVAWRKRAQIQGTFWLAAWGGIWLGQQLLISAIEQDPRYFQAAFPFMALLVALVAAHHWAAGTPWLRRGVATLVLAASLLGAASFKATFSPVARATHWLVQEYGELKAGNEPAILGTSSYLALRLAFYMGLDTLAHPGLGQEATHWVDVETGYTRSRAAASPPPHLRLWRRAIFKSAGSALFERLGYSPGVGLSTSVELHGHLAENGGAWVGRI